MTSEPVFGNEFGFYPPCEDVFTEVDCYVWYQLVDNDYDLEIGRASETCIGDPPDWFQFEEAEDSVDFFLDHSYLPFTNTQYGDFGNRFTIFGLEEGIAPYQPFLIRHSRPKYYKLWSDYGYEYDVQFNWEIVQVMRLSDFDILRRWEWWFSARNASMCAIAEAKQEYEALRKTDLSAMYLKVEPYFTRDQPSFCDMTFPRGTKAVLATKHGGHLLAGYSDDGDYTNAILSLEDKVTDEMPHVRPVFGTLPRRRF